MINSLTMKCYLLAAVLTSLAAEYLSVEEVYPAVVRQKRSADMSDRPRDLTVVVAQHRLNLEQNSVDLSSAGTGESDSVYPIPITEFLTTYLNDHLLTLYQIIDFSCDKEDFKFSFSEFPGAISKIGSSALLLLPHMSMHSSELISPFFVSHHEGQDGEDTYIKGHVNCFYHGSVEGHPDWHVAMSTCQGLRGIFGDPGHRDNYYYVEPTNEGTSMAQSHTLYRGYADGGNSSCGVCSKQKHHTSHKEPLLPPSSSRLVRRQGKTRIVEWVLVNDYSQYQAFGENLTAVVLRDLEIANLVDSFFRPLDIRVVVVFTTTWTKGNKIQYPSDFNVNVAFERFAVFEQTIRIEHDSTMLLTGEDLPGPVAGVARIGGMCRGVQSVGVVEDGKRWFLGVLATITAHELGHIFNMEHDDYAICTCTDPTNICIMAANTSAISPATTWSSCSVSYLNEGYRLNLDRCLFNTPRRTLEDPVCGNGIREGDETCDCGSFEECTDKCCNPLTCRLASGAQCNAGECCSENCRFHPHGTVCLNASNECDIMEYCSGDSSNCPRDVYKQDTTPCHDEQSYCYSGQCPSKDDQCKLYFGTGSRNAPPSCYSVANVLGSSFGNCGSSSTRYLPCTPEHVDCGQLQCESGTFNRELLRGLNYRSRSTSLPSSLVCRSFTLPPGSDTLSLGLVQEGTKCGNESMCLAQSCMAISSLMYIKPCPVGSNNLTCAGTGVCNNLNECSCEVGLVGATCEQRNTSRKLSGGDIAGIFFGLLLGLLVAGSVAAVIVFALCRQENRNPPYTSRNRSSSSTHSFSKSSSTQKSTLSSKPLPKVTPSKPLPKAAPPRPAPLARPLPKPMPSRPPPKASHSPAPIKPSQPDRTPGKRPPPPRPPVPRC